MIDDIHITAYDMSSDEVLDVIDKIKQNSKI